MHLQFGESITEFECEILAASSYEKNQASKTYARTALCEKIHTLKSE